MSARRRPPLAVLPALLGLVLAVSEASAGSFFFVPGDAAQGETRIDWITHPNGYDGTGGTVDVSYCIDPTSANAADMVVPLENVIRTFNGQVPTTGNRVLGGANNVPALSIDFEQSGSGSSEQWAREMAARLETGEAHVFRESGEVPGALAGAASRLEAVYRTPLVAHACMEPLNCTAWLRPDGALEMHGACQSPTLMRWGAGRGRAVAF